MRDGSGWAGRFFEDFTLGELYWHPIGRTVTETDEVWFCTLVTSPNQLHFNRDYAARTSFGQAAVNAPFTNALVTGISEMDVGQNCLTVGWNYIRMPNPLFVGETVYARSEVVLIEDGYKEDCGIVTVKSTGFTESGKTVIEAERRVMVWRRGRAPRDRLWEERPGPAIKSPDGEGAS